MLAMVPGERVQSPRAAIALIGEAKATIQPRGLKDLDRLEHIRTLLVAQGHRPDDAVLALFSLHGFHRDAIDAAARRSDVLRAASMLGGVDGLANVAGMVKMAPALEHVRSLWDDQFAVNVFGPFEVTRLMQRE